MKRVVSFSATFFTAVIVVVAIFAAAAFSSSNKAQAYVLIPKPAPVVADPIQSPAPVPTATAVPANISRYFGMSLDQLWDLAKEGAFNDLAPDCPKVIPRPYITWEKTLWLSQFAPNFNEDDPRIEISTHKIREALAEGGGSFKKKGKISIRSSVIEKDLVLLYVKGEINGCKDASGQLVAYNIQKLLDMISDQSVVIK